MGQCFRIINVTKKQFIDIGHLGENNKFHGIGQGLNGIALGRLLAFKASDCIPDQNELYIGAWAGDSIVITGDHYDFHDSDISSSNSDNLHQNLYYSTEHDSQYEDITHKVISWLAKDDDIADLLADRAQRYDNLLKF